MWKEDLLFVLYTYIAKAKNLILGLIENFLVFSRNYICYYVPMLVVPVITHFRN